jgi:hypothetical protein
MEERARKCGKLTEELEKILVQMQKPVRIPDTLFFTSRDPLTMAKRFEQLGGVRRTNKQGQVIVDWRGLHITIIPITEGEFA